MVWNQETSSRSSDSEMVDSEEEEYPCQKNFLGMITVRIRAVLVKKYSSR